MVLRAAADGVLKRIQTEQPNFAFDPATIMVIIEIIKALLPVIVEFCGKSPGDAPTLANLALTGGVLGENRYFRIARRVARREVGFRDYMLSGGDTMLKSLLEEASEKDETTMEAIYAEL